MLLGLAPAIQAGSQATKSPAEPDPTAAVAQAVIAPWRPVFQGIEVCEASTRQPRPLQARALRVDLRSPGIEFLVTPSNGSEPLEVNARTTSDFLREFKCQAAINGSVFAPFAQTNLQPMNIEGLSLSRGDLYSGPEQYHSLMLSTNGRAWIARDAASSAGGFNGLSGFYSLLYRGRNEGTHKERHPRSAAGISQDGRWLILLVIDGRQPGYSEGVTTAETAEWMRRLGAFDALNLDGGGSSALVIEGTNGSPVVLNRPSGGTERRVANHLGIFARKLQEK